MILKPEHMDKAVKEPWMRNQVDRYLSDIRYWLYYGYEPTNVQLKLIEHIYDETHGRNDR